MDFKQAFEKSAKMNALCYNALRDCQRALCPDFGDCADNLKDGEKCACGFEDGPFASAVPQNRALAKIARLRAECARLEDHINDADDENIRLRAEVERLTAALKKIVSEAESDDGLSAWDGADIARAALAAGGKA